MNSLISFRWAALLLGLTSLGTAAPVPLVNHGDSWHYHKGTNAPQANWKILADGSLDSTWATGNGGFGYADNTPETANCQTLLADMRGSAANNYLTVYLRKQFTVSSALATNLHLFFRVDFDDGYMVWLDGNYLTNRLVNGAPNEPAYTATSSGSHESSLGSNGGPVETNDFGPASLRLDVGTHTLAILGLNQNNTSSDFIQVADLYLEVPPPPPPSVTNVWRAVDSPIVLTTNVTIANRSTLIIEPGVTVRFGSGLSLTVANGGCLLAEGSADLPILFTRSGSSGFWGNIVVNGAVGSPETRIRYAQFEFNANSTGTPCIQVSAGSVFLDHLTFRNTGAPYLHLDGASFVVQDCHFPSATGLFESVHGTSGIRSDGHGFFLRNFFGKANSTSGNYNDVLDFTGGNRPGPILVILNNVFIGTDDDHLDLDSTDAWVEGNIFLHAHRNGSPDSASGVSGGADNADTSQITILGNIFYDCDQAAMAKQGNFYTLINNTIVHQTHQGGVDTEGAVICMDDPGYAEGAGMYLEGNVIYDAEKLVRAQTASLVMYTNSVLWNVQNGSWAGPGGNNLTADPMFQHVPDWFETTNFNTWAEAQVLWDWFTLLPGSPALGAGSNSQDLGAVIPFGASISGEPTGTTSQTDATLQVGVNRTGSGIPSAGWPDGSGFVSYKWRLDTNAWSAEVPIHTPILLTGLTDGVHWVEVVGRIDAGLYQDDPIFGPDARVSRSHSWTVQSGAAEPHIRSASYSAGQFTLSFEAEAGRTYSVLHTSTPQLQDSWLKWTDVPAPPTNGLQTVTDLTVNGANHRFYRVVTPALP